MDYLKNLYKLENIFLVIFLCKILEIYYQIIPNFYFQDKSNLFTNFAFYFLFMVVLGVIFKYYNYFYL
jgi:hypothetical protein